MHNKNMNNEATKQTSVKKLSRQATAKRQAAAARNADAIMLWLKNEIDRHESTRR
jgi:hypothetical protein